MPKDERKAAVLDFMARTGLALPPRAVYTNMAREGATFSEKSVQRYLRELADEGALQKLEEPRGYYLITQAGHERAQLD